MDHHVRAGAEPRQRSLVGHVPGTTRGHVRQRGSMGSRRIDATPAAAAARGQPAAQASRRPGDRRERLRWGGQAGSSPESAGEEQGARLERLSLPEEVWGRALGPTSSTRASTPWRARRRRPRPVRPRRLGSLERTAPARPAASRRPVDREGGDVAALQLLDLGPAVHSRSCVARHCAVVQDQVLGPPSGHDLAVHQVAQVSGIQPAVAGKHGVRRRGSPKALQRIRQGPRTKIRPPGARATAAALRTSSSWP